MFQELKAILKDEGVLLFFLFLPIGYPLLYSWIYNNEVVREVPVALVDNSHSSLSRTFAEKLDASPDVNIAYKCADMLEAQSLIGHSKAYGIIYIPADFDRNIGRLQQSHVSVYCDMSYMLTYKAIFGAATAVALDMGADIQKKLLGNKTDREDQISTSPLAYEEVPIFNTTSGYGNFILPGVLVLIIQQAILLGVGMIAGTEREKGFANYAGKKESSRLMQAIGMLGGKAMAYVLIFSVMLAWITLAVPHIFGFVSMVHGKDLFLFLTPYLLACIFFAITFSEMVRYRESVMLIVVFTSVPLLFMSGVSWPQSNIPAVWQGVSTLFPSTFGIRGFLRMSSMGALLPDVAVEFKALWIQVAVYASTSLFVVWRRVKKEKQDMPPHNNTKHTKNALLLTLLAALTMLTSCVDVDEYNNTAADNTEALWKIMDEHYCFFEEKKEILGVDWNDVHTRYTANVDNNMSRTQLFEFLGKMLSELKDGHVNLATSFDYARNWSWKENYPANFADTLQRRYLGTDYKIASGMYYRILDDNTGYIYLGSFSDAIGDGNLDEVLLYLAPCNGLILDIRNNGGGMLSEAERVAARFCNEKTLVGTMKHKTGTGHNDFSEPQEQYITPSAGIRWQKKVCVLTNRSVYSAANEFVKYMKCMPQVTVVGDRTGGGSGMPFTSELPNGWSVRFSACPMYDIDGNSTEGGIDPDVNASITDEDWKKSIDTIIETARRIIRIGE